MTFKKSSFHTRKRFNRKLKRGTSNASHNIGNFHGSDLEDSHVKLIALSKALIQSINHVKRHKILKTVRHERLKSLEYFRTQSLSFIKDTHVEIFNGEEFQSIRKLFYIDEGHFAYCLDKNSYNPTASQITLQVDDPYPFHLQIDVEIIDYREAYNIHRSVRELLAVFKQFSSSRNDNRVIGLYRVGEAYFVIKHVMVDSYENINYNYPNEVKIYPILLTATPAAASDNGAQEANHHPSSNPVYTAEDYIREIKS